MRPPIIQIGKPYIERGGLCQGSALCGVGSLATPRDNRLSAQSAGLPF